MEDEDDVIFDEILDLVEMEVGLLNIIILQTLAINPCSTMPSRE